MSNIDIRTASATDVPALVELVREYWAFEAIEGFDAARVAALLDELLAQPARGRVWLATTGDRPAGYLLGVYIFSLEYLGITAEIDEFFVRPALRGLGVGRRLLATAEEAFRSGDCTHVALRIGRENSAAREFYRRHGYRDRDGFEIIDKSL